MDENSPGRMQKRVLEIVARWLRKVAMGLPNILLVE